MIFKKTPINIGESGGASSRIRTYDLLIRSQVVIFKNIKEFEYLVHQCNFNVISSVQNLENVISASVYFSKYLNNKLANIDAMICITV